MKAKSRALVNGIVWETTEHMCHQRKRPTSHRVGTNKFKDAFNLQAMCLGFRTRTRVERRHPVPTGKDTADQVEVYIMRIHYSHDYRQRADKGPILSHVHVHPRHRTVTEQGRRMGRRGHCLTFARHCPYNAYEVGKHNFLLWSVLTTH